MQLTFFNPYAEIRETRNRLPHWQQEGAVYFLTFRLADSIPQDLRDQWQDEWEAWMQHHPEPWDQATERSITSDSRVPWSDGWMTGMGRAFCGERNVPPS